jgi:hypothetical protein
MEDYESLDYKVQKVFLEGMKGLYYETILQRMNDDCSLFETLFKLAQVQYTLTMRDRQEAEEHLYLELQQLVTDMVTEMVSEGEIII